MFILWQMIQESRFLIEMADTVQEKIVQEFCVYTVLYILNNTGHIIHKHQSKFYEIANQLLSKYCKFKGKNRDNAK